MKTPKRFLITGCSGGGKSTLLAALSDAGYDCVLEPGRRVIAKEIACGGDAFPDTNPMGFAKACRIVALTDFAEAAALNDPVFFDRGLLDATVALQHLNAPSGTVACPYDDPIFLAPPWPETFEHDAMRTQSFEEAQAEYNRIVEALAMLGRSPIKLPESSVPDRVTFVLSHI